MANEKAWEDRDAIINIDEGWKKCFYDITALFQEAEKVKFEVLDDSTRVAELKKIIDEDPRFTISALQVLHTEIKSVYDFMMALRG